MAQTVRKYDAMLICFGLLNRDARTLNLAAMLAGNQYKTAVIALGQAQDQSGINKGFDFIPVEPTGNRRASMRYMDFYRQAKKIMGEIEAGTVFAMDLYSLGLARLAKKRFKSRVIYDSREIYSALGPLSGQNIKQNLLSFLENRLVGIVDEIMVSGSLDADYLASYFKKKFRYHIIQNLPPKREAVKSDLLRDKFNIPPDKKILVYQGMVLPGRGLRIALEALRFTEKFTLCIIGEGSYTRELQAEAERLKVEDKVIFCGPMPYGELHELTCSADIGLCFIEPVSFSYELALPNKLFEYIMAEIPVLASDLPAIRKVYGEFIVGCILPAGSAPERIAHSLECMIIEPDRQAYIAQCRKAKEQFCYESQAGTILSIMENT